MKRQFNIVGQRKIYFIISSCLVLATILCAVFMGVKLDIDFKGGSILTYSYTGELDENAVQKTVEDTLKAEVSIQVQTDLSTQTEKLVISLNDAKALSTEQQAALTDALKTGYPDNHIEDGEVSNVDPVMGQEFLMKCLLAVAVAFVLMIVYIAFRFRKIGGWSAGVMSVIALLHDAIMVFATFVIFGFPLDDNFIAVILTILGYSINATIVIYDRIRENRSIHGDKMEIGSLVNLSINQTLSRNIYTSLAATSAMVVVCIVALVFNVSSILCFALPMIVGMVSGLYSSVCLSGPLWVMWQEHKAKNAGSKKKKK